MPRAHPLAKPHRFRAVDQVSLTLRTGERLGLVGESGSGKSTLTRALLGLIPISAGSLTLSGQQMDPRRGFDRAARAQMQVVFQDPYGSFNPRHRAARLVAEPLHLCASPPNRADRDRLVAEALTAVGLSPKDARRHIHAFSGGQRQRLAIARALILKPKVVLLDEAVSALDVQVRAQILDLLETLGNSHGLTTLFVSHDLSVVRSVTDRVMVMRHGRIVEEGATAQVLETPNHPYTRALLRAVPMLPD